MQRRPKPLERREATAKLVGRLRHLHKETARINELIEREFEGVETFLPNQEVVSVRLPRPATKKR